MSLVGAVQVTEIADLMVLLECVTESEADEHINSFVLLDGLENDPIGVVDDPSDLRACSSMPLIFPLMDTESYKIHNTFLYFWLIRTRKPHASTHRNHD